MQVQSMHFKARSGQKLADVRLQQNLKVLSQRWTVGRTNAIAELDDFEATRDEAVERRNRALANLDVWLERFEAQATARGATVLWAETPEDASKLVVEIARRHEVAKVTKSKSMVSEEMALNRHLEAAGVKVVETDLGEYILQINDNEPPSHIVAPVVHKSKDEVSDLFARVHKRPRLTDIPQMTREAREFLRPQFLSSDMGVSGGNFLIAETGSVAVFTNEGNEGMCTVLPPKVHVVVTGIEKVIPTLEDLATMARLLPRSATGQSTPSYVGLEKTLDLPQAATLCGECHVVCPMKIPLPDLLRKLRERQFERGLRPWRERLGMAAWAFAARRPAVYRPLARIGARVLGWMGGDAHRISSLPGGSGWSLYRDMPSPVGPTFKERWAKQGRRTTPR